MFQINMHPNANVEPRYKVFLWKINKNLMKMRRNGEPKEAFIEPRTKPLFRPLRGYYIYKRMI